MRRSPVSALAALALFGALASSAFGRAPAPPPALQTHAVEARQAALTPSLPTERRSAVDLRAAADPGGRALALRLESGVAVLSWAAGTAQTGYLVARLAAGGLSVLPASGPLPASATTFADPTPLPGVNCYFVLPLGASGPALGISDWLCVLPGVASPTRAPRLVTIQLNQTSTATLTWVEPAGGGQDGYLLQPLGEAPIPLPGSAVRSTHSMAGVTCYVLFATSSGAPIGWSDIFCGLPGRSNLAPTTTAPFKGGALPSDTSGTVQINPGGQPGGGAGSIDLSLQIPPIADQGAQNSCTGWAVAYYVKSYYEAIEQQRSPTQTRFSPSFIYNQCNAGRRAGTDEGCSLADAIRVMQQTGALLLDDFPYNPADYQHQPTAQQI